MFYGARTPGTRRLTTVIPLHLRTTTIHVTDRQATRLLALGAAEWLSGARALVAIGSGDQEILAALDAA
jgi:hypothetical protein